MTLGASPSVAVISGLKNGRFSADAEQFGVSRRFCGILLVTKQLLASIPMASDRLHAPRERLRKETLHMHQAITSLMEELEAVDWYQQRADDCDDPTLKAILLHNMREEIEHAAMALEWLRRNSKDFDKELKAYLFTTEDIVARENAQN
jgi:hypothetical protein